MPRVHPDLDRQPAGATAAGRDAAGRALRGPDFFIVGAPKSGTTSLQGWLSTNPDVFLAPGEPHFFSPERQLAWRARTWDDYLREFQSGQAARRLGEKAVWYLSTEAAPARISAYMPAAQIIVLLRHPIEAMRSLHGYNLFYGEEDIDDFFAALEAEPERRAGARIREGSHMPWNLYYRDAVNYAPQVARYFDRFGPERVHVILFEDLRSDPEGTYAGVTGFLGISGQTPQSFATLNANKVPRSEALQSVLYGRGRRLVRPAKRLLPLRSRRWLHRKLERANTRERRAPELDAARRRELELNLAAEVEELAGLIGRDLSAWMPADMR